MLLADGGHVGQVEPGHERLERGARHEPRRRRLLERFDANHNGVLDPDERDAARQSSEQRRRDHEERMADMLRRFDADGNGTLDEAERAAARGAP